jgi:predicted ester cyclase
MSILKMHFTLEEEIPMDSATAAALVRPFYDALNCPAEKDVRALVESYCATDWRSYAGEGNSKGREEFIQQVMGFGKIMPDLTWKVIEILPAGENRIVVRSTVTGTPVAPLMGLPPSGKSFQTMVIDLHTIKDGKAIEAWHVEDWAGAMRQLK